MTRLLGLSCLPVYNEGIGLLDFIGEEKVEILRSQSMAAGPDPHKGLEMCWADCRVPAEPDDQPGWKPLS